MKKVRLIPGLLIVVCILSGISCSDNDFEVNRLNYGTSFGMCIGYCRHDMALEPGFVTYTKSGWQDTVEAISCRDELDQDAWQFFRTGLDVTKFLDLPETIGCPDCADGGAEWIEAELANGERHKVTFEYGNAPDVLKVYLDSLRNQMKLSSQCGD